MGGAVLSRGPARPPRDSLREAFTIQALMLVAEHGGDAMLPRANSAYGPFASFTARRGADIDDHPAA